MKQISEANNSYFFTKILDVRYIQLHNNARKTPSKIPFEVYFCPSPGRLLFLVLFILVENSIGLYTQGYKQIIKILANFKLGIERIL